MVTFLQEQEKQQAGAELGQAKLKLGLKLRFEVEVWSFAV